MTVSLKGPAALSSEVEGDVGAGKGEEHVGGLGRVQAFPEQAARRTAGARALGKYAANAAWVALAVIAFNLARTAAVAAGLAKARWATVRTRIINLPARIAATGRRLVLHLPIRWPWALVGHRRS